jgi:cysteine desulfurase family protein
MLTYLRDIGATPGRSGHRLATAAERVRFDARLAVAELFGVSDPLRVVFTLNATHAINLVLHGLLTAGGHVLTTRMEHNAVMRPLRELGGRRVTVTALPCGPDGIADADRLEASVRSDTRLIVATHASNVCGAVQPIGALGACARRCGIPFLVDAAQTGGCWPIDLSRESIDLLAFSGHKGLLGPPGTGGLVLHPEFEPTRLPSLFQGGTGSRSEFESQPECLPDKYEAGTPNTAGLAGLAAGVRFVLKRGVHAIREHEQRLTDHLLAGLRRIPGVRTIGPQTAAAMVGVVSFAIAGWSPADVAQSLDEDFDILCRPGLHCAPQAHRTLGTFPAGTVRLSLGPLTGDADVGAAVAAVAELAGRRHG